MMSVVDKDDIEMRIAALKATALTNGAESTDGLWILLKENAKAKKAFPGAISLRELLGISDDSMVQHALLWKILEEAVYYRDLWFHTSTMERLYIYIGENN